MANYDREGRDLFKLKAPILIKSKKAAEWKEWQNTKLLKQGQMGFIADKNFLVCGDGTNPNVLLEGEVGEANSRFEVKKADVNGTQEYRLGVKDMLRVPFMLLAPLYGYRYDKTTGAPIKENNVQYVYKRNKDDYFPVDGALLLLYDNYDDFQEDQIFPDDRK